MRENLNILLDPYLNVKYVPDTDSNTNMFSLLFCRVNIVPVPYVCRQMIVTVPVPF
jgi:hypothetical protein